MSDLIHPLTALTLLGRTYKRQDGDLVTTCPCCQRDLYILERSFVCSGPSCKFSRGDAVDLMAWVDGTYHGALSMVAEHEPYYQDRILEESREYMARRRLIEFSLEAEQKNFDPDVERLTLRQKFSEHCTVPPAAFCRGHWYLTSEQSDRLVLVLAEMGVTPPPNLQGRATAVAPFWGSHHEISRLYVVAETMRTLKVCELAPFRSSWFGLSQMHPANKDLDVFPEYVDAMENEERFRLHFPYRFPTQVHVNAQAGQSGIKTNVLRFHVGSSWPRDMATWSLVPDFETAKFILNDEEYSLCETLEHLLAASMEDFSVFVDMCGAMKLGNQARAHLLQLAHGMMDQRLAAMLRRVLSRRLLEKDEKGSIFECANGYEIQAGDRVKMVTNFTLDFVAVTSFSVLADQLYAGKLYVGSATLDFEIPSKKLDSPTQLMSTLQNLQTLRPGGSAAGEPLAVIHNSQAFRRVMEVLRARASDLPRKRGVSQLGWTHKQDQFLTPLACVDAYGIHHGIRYHADALSAHHCYSSDLPAAPELGEMPELDPYLAELISALVAQTMRFFYGFQVRPLPLQNNIESRARGLQLFRGFGQTSPLLLRGDNIMGQSLEVNRGMPCLIQGLNELQAAKVQMAGAWLADKGLDLQRFDPAQIEKAADVLPSIILETCRRLLAGNPVAYREKRSVRPISAQAEEGAALIRTEFWPKWPEAGVRWGAVDRLLEKKEEALKQLARVDDAKDQVVLPDILWIDLDIEAEDLPIAFGLLCDEVKAEKHRLLVDRKSFYRLLADFYGDVPKLQLV